MTKPICGPWLVSGGELPFTAEMVREQINLLDPSFDKLIQTVIFSECNRLGIRMTGAVWAVSRGDDLADFYSRAHKIGKLVKIGPAYERQGTTYHDCEYGVDTRDLAKAFRAVCNWCWDEEAISRAILRERRGEYRTVWPIVRGADLSRVMEAAE